MAFPDIVGSCNILYTSPGLHVDTRDSSPLIRRMLFYIGGDVGGVGRDISLGSTGREVTTNIHLGVTQGSVNGRA